MMKLCAQATRIWSAVTCHRFCRFGDLSPKQGRLQRPGRVGRLPAFDGDKSPAKSADKSAHSKAIRKSLLYNGVQSNVPKTEESFLRPGCGVPSNLANSLSAKFPPGCRSHDFGMFKSVQKNPKKC